MRKMSLFILCVFAAHLASSHQGTHSVSHNSTNLIQSKGDIVCNVDMYQYLKVSFCDNDNSTAIVFNILMESLSTPDWGLNQSLR